MSKKKIMYGLKLIQMIYNTKNGEVQIIQNNFKLIHIKCKIDFYMNK